MGESRDGPRRPMRQSATQQPHHLLDQTATTPVSQLVDVPTTGSHYTGKLHKLHNSKQYNNLIV